MSNPNMPQKPKVSLASVKALSNLPASLLADEAVKQVVAAPAKTAASQPVSQPAMAVEAKPVNTKPVNTKPADTKPAAAKPIAAMAEPVKIALAKTDLAKVELAKSEPAKVSAVSAPQPVTAVKDAPVTAPAVATSPKPESPKPAFAEPATAMAKAVAAETATVSIPGFAAMGEAILQRQLSAARNLGNLQKMTLDHAVTEIQAGLDEVEELSRTTSLSDALLIQARAFRRGQEAMMSYFSKLAEAARP